MNAKRFFIQFVLALLGIYLLVLIGFYFTQELFLFPSSSLDQDYVFKDKKPFSEVFLNADDGAKLHAIHFQQEHPKGIILYFHGNMHNLKRWSKEVQPLMEYGYDILLMDYRGYGKSTGKRTQESMYQDTQLAYDYGKERFGEDSIIVYGRSLGSTFAIYAAAHNQAKQLILETPFYSMETLVKERYPMLPSYLLNYSFPSNEFLPLVNCPVTIFHGNNDKIVPVENCRKLLGLNNQITYLESKKSNHHNQMEQELFKKQMNVLLK